MQMHTPLLRWLWAMACGIALACPAFAEPIEIGFDFTGSSISILGGLIEVPPDGSISSGSGVLRLDGTGGVPVAGGAQLKDLNLAGTFSKSTFGLNIDGSIAATQPAAAGGVLTAGLSSVNLPNPFVMNFSGFANCTGGTGCGVLSLPANLSGPQTFTIGAMPVANLASPGNAMLNGTFSLTIGGFSALLTLVGTEVSRTIIPEPASAGLLTLGLLGLVALRRRR